VFAHSFKDSCVNMVDTTPYWRDVGTVDAYWEANMDLTSVVPELNLYDDDWPILSLQRQLAPAKFVFDEAGRKGEAHNSLVSSGCIVSGAIVRHSILFSKVKVREGSLIEDSWCCRT
jgi:glucose-1-phosphate adenylyltransferase